MIHSMRLSLVKGAHADPSSKAWQEIVVGYHSNRRIFWSLESEAEGPAVSLPTLERLAGKVIKRTRKQYKHQHRHPIVMQGIRRRQ